MAHPQAVMRIRRPLSATLAGQVRLSRTLEVFALLTALTVFGSIKGLPETLSREPE